MSRVFNFSAGPGVLPEPVLERIRDDALDWQDTGMSVMEHSHRGADFENLANEVEAKLRRLAHIPDDYHVLFLHGPGRIHFSGVPLNLAGEGGRANYVDTGLWSRMATREGQRLCDARLIASSEDTNFDRIPHPASWQVDDSAAYVHYTPNETINGVEFFDVPDTGKVPLVADMSSNIFSRPMDISRFGLIYGGAQKNCGISGLSLVIARKSLLERACHRMTPEMLNYAGQAKARSLVATAPTFPWYVAGLVFDWLEAEGGLEAIGARNERKAAKLYDYIDNSNFYTSPVDKAARSRMNVPFTLADEGLNNNFLEQAKEAGMVALKGHRAVGGMRASLYNAMPEAGVESLVTFMRDFVQRHG